MADLLNVYKICLQCKGVGEVTEGKIIGEDKEEVFEIITCPMCNGNKELLWGQMREEELE